MQTEILAYVLLAIFIVISEKYIRNPEAKSWRANRKLDWTTMVYLFAAWAIFLITPLLNVLNILEFQYEIIGWIGILLLLAGLTLRVIAMKTLGKYYSRTLIVLARQKIIDRGPYKYIRHPGYSGTILAGFGFALAQMNLLPVVLVVVLVIVVFRTRVTTEEKLLEKNFGTSYQEYQARTKKLIPYVF